MLSVKKISLICNSQNHKAHYFEYRIRIQIPVMTMCCIQNAQTFENLYNFVIYIKYVFVIELVSVLALSKICILAYLFVRQPPRCIVKVLQSLFNIVSTLYTVSDCIEGNNAMNLDISKLSGVIGSLSLCASLKMPFLHYSFIVMNQMKIG